MFQVPLNNIKGLTIERKGYVKQEEETLLLLLENDRLNGKVEVLRAGKIRELKREIEKRIEKIRKTLKVPLRTH